MATFHLTLLQLVQATQQALVSVPPSRVYVEREGPLALEDCPAINIVPGDSRFESLGSEDGTYDLLQVTAAFTLRVHSRGDPHTQQADPVIAQAHTALMADPSLGGWCLRLRIVSSRPQQAAADSTAGIYELGYEATLVVGERDLVLRPV